MRGMSLILDDMIRACIRQFSNEAGEDLPPWQQAYIASVLAEDFEAERMI
jgi:hypothetical protein